jgi:FAD dependent oxidoreductase
MPTRRSWCLVIVELRVEPIQDFDRSSPVIFQCKTGTGAMTMGQEPTLTITFYHAISLGILDNLNPVAGWEGYVRRDYGAAKSRRSAFSTGFNLVPAGIESPMGTVHGLSKYPYLRESRRIIGRPAYGYEDGFTIDEVTVSRQDFSGSYYQSLDRKTFRDLAISIAGLRTIDVIMDKIKPKDVKTLGRSHFYPDSVGIGHYPLDFHPCMVETPPQKPGNQEHPGERQGAYETFPFQIPLRSMIPQKIDNLLVTGKSMATSHITSSAYRVQAIEWSTGAAAGTTSSFVLETGILPFQLINNLPNPNPNLEKLQQRLNANNNPTAFPNTSILNTQWQQWK